MQMQQNGGVKFELLTGNKLSHMEDLFSTNLAVNNQNTAYRVVFDHDRYVFFSEDKQSVVPSFSFRREHDEWVEEEMLAPEIKQQAIDALEKYLLKQH